VHALRSDQNEETHDYDETDEADKEDECVWVLGELKSVLGLQGSLVSFSYHEQT
jgi:hypothetical protein